jgi:hypothetical protein
MLLFGFESGETDLIAIGHEIQRLEKIIDDLWLVTGATIHKHLIFDDAPLLERWQFASRTAPCLVGLSTDHPKLPGQERPIITSDLLLISESAGLARTASRWYRLGKKAALSLQ